MTDIEQRLRDELKAAAAGAQPHMLRELRLPTRRRGGRRAQWAMPVAAVIAVAVVIVGVRVAIRTVQPRPGPAAVAGMPRFYVAVAAHGGRAVVARSAAGAVISTIMVPGARIDGVSAAPDDRTFVLSAWSGSGSAQVTRFYAVHLAADGRPSGPTALPLTVRAGSAGYSVTGIALSPDTRQLAVAVVPQSLQGTRPTLAHRSRIEIVTLATGVVHTWVAAAEVNVSVLSWAAGSQRLGYLSNDLRGIPRSPIVTRLGLLDTTRPGGALAASSSPVTLRTGGAPIDSALITAGHTVLAWTGPASSHSGEVLAKYSVHTGQRLRVLYRGPGHGNFVVHGDLPSADPSGSHVLINIQTVRGTHIVFGRLDNGRFTVLPSPAQQVEPVPAAW